MMGQLPKGWFKRNSSEIAYADDPMSVRVEFRNLAQTMFGKRVNAWEANLINEKANNPYRRRQLIGASEKKSVVKKQVIDYLNKEFRL